MTSNKVHQENLFSTDSFANIQRYLKFYEKTSYVAPHMATGCINTNKKSKSLTDKSNKTCRKIFQSRKDNEKCNIQENECSINCKNLYLINKYEMRIKELFKANEDITMINEHLIMLVKNKDDLYIKISTENSNLKLTLSNLNNYIRNKNNFNKNFVRNKYKICDEKSENAENIVTDNIREDKKNVNHILNQFENQNSFNEKLVDSIKNWKNNINNNGTNVNNKVSSIQIQTLQSQSYNFNKMMQRFEKNQNTELKSEDNLEEVQLQNQNQFQDDEDRNKNRQNEKLKSKNSRINNFIIKSSALKDLVTNKANIHYEKINDMNARNHTRKYKGDSRISYLSMDEYQFKKFISDELLKEIYNLSMSDDTFIQTMRYSSDDKMVSYCDTIGNTIKDYYSIIKLLFRIKSYLNSNLNLITSALKHDSCINNILIKTANELLECEKTSLFLYDKFTNSLKEYIEDDLGKSDLVINIDQEIIGACFKSGKKIRVDEPYSDERFNKERDLRIGSNTKNILYSPLQDKDGIIFGVFQSINKKSGTFNNDDEELIQIFCIQASIILKNSMNFDENIIFISRLKMILNYNINLGNIRNSYEFTLLTEQLLTSVFATNCAQLLLFDSKNQLLYHSNKFNIENENLGLINHVKSTKQLYACSSSDDCKFYNKIIDLDTNYGLITFPILKWTNENHLLGIAQVSYNEKFINNKIKRKDLEIIELIGQITSRWISSNCY